MNKKTLPKVGSSNVAAVARSLAGASGGGMHFVVFLALDLLVEDTSYIWLDTWGYKASPRRRGTY